MANTTGYDAGVQVSRRPSPAQQQTSSYSHKYQFYLQYPPDQTIEGMRLKTNFSCQPRDGPRPVLIPASRRFRGGGGGGGGPPPPPARPLANRQSVHSTRRPDARTGRVESPSDILYVRDISMCCYCLASCYALLHSATRHAPGPGPGGRTPLANARAGTRPGDRQYTGDGDERGAS
jgi:hypothetical protein